MQIKDIRLIYQAVALAFEKITGVMASVVMEMSHEGFGRVVVFADDIVLCEKYFKDAHRFSFRTYEKLEEEGEKYLKKAQEKYNKYKLETV
jgi:probable nitrogen fixation protein